MPVAGEVVIAAVAAAYAYGCYRAGAFFDWRWRWVTRGEDPQQFRATLVLYSGVALIFAGLALRNILAA